jgi:hypothetical protein
MTSFATAFSQVESLYVGYFGRAGDPAGANYWIGVLNAGALTLGQVAASFAVQPEATTKYPYLADPNVADPVAFIEQIYRNLFNHAADPAGLAYWAAQLQAASGNPQAIGQFILNVISGAIAADNLAITNKVDVAQDFTTQDVNFVGGTWNAITAAQSALEIAAVNESPASVTAAKAETIVFFSSMPGLQLNFTLQVDSLETATARANFHAPLIFNPPTGTYLQSLQSMDSAIDTGSAGTLTATLNSGANTSLVTLQGIPTAIVTSLANGSGFNGNITGLTTLSNSGSTGCLTLGTAGRGLNTALGTVNISSSGVAAGANTQAFVSTAALAGAADMVAVNITGAIGTSTVGVGAAQVVLLNDGPAGTATTPMNAYETETIGSTSAGFLQLSNAASGVLSTSTLILSGAGALQLSAGAGGDFANLTRIDASASTGGVTITGLTNVGSTGAAFNAGAAGLLTTNTRLTSFTGGSGVDFLDISNMTAAQVGAVTTLSGGAGRDTLVLDAAVLNTTTTLSNSGFEIVGATEGLAGTINVSKLGANVDTLQLFGAQGNTATITNAPSTFTLQLNGFAVFADYNIQGPSGSSDVLNIFDSFAVGPLVVTGYESVNFTASASELVFSIKASPSVGTATTLNIIDNAAACGCDFDIQIGPTDVGTGTINVSGTGIGGVAIYEVTAAALNASGLNVGAGPDVRGLGMAIGATGTINILGSNGSDFLVGSGGADVISGGPGNDIIANTSRTAVTGGATLTGGSGDDTFFLSGAAAPGALAALYAATPTIIDFLVNPGTSSADLLMLSPFSVSYGVASLQATTSDPGEVQFQAIGSSGSTAMLDATSEMVKLTQAVGTTGLTLQQAFNAAIGSATITGATANGSYFVTLYDSTNSKAAIGIVTATNGTNTVIEAGDVVVLVGSLNISSSGYATLTTSQLAFDTPS